MARFIIIWYFLFLWTVQEVQAQSKSLFRDTTDGALDVSDWLINAHGFLPVVTIITEPALGNFGGAMAPVFFQPKNKYIADTTIKHKPLYIPPDISAAIGLYTANGSWGIGGGRNGNWLRQRIRYRVGGGYFNLNLAFYREMQYLGQKEFDVNFKVVPLYVHGIRQILYSKWYIGLQYLFLHSQIQMKDGGTLPSFISAEEAKSTLSIPGILLEYDGRDNAFTPNSGAKFHVNTMWSDKIFGSDFNYVNLNAYLCYYMKLANRWTGGIRFDAQHNFGDTPFYMLGYINMRGIPIMRYQGTTVALTEVESRWDFTRRWSSVVFTGVGKTFENKDALDEGEWAYSAGTGFRYLLAQKLKLRCGIDIARGPEQWAYYLVLGNAWIK